MPKFNLTLPTSLPSCDSVVEKPCHKNMKKITRRRNLPGDAEETAPSQSRKDPVP